MKTHFHKTFMRSSISNQSLSPPAIYWGMYFFVEIIFWQCSVFVFCWDCFADCCFVCSPRYSELLLCTVCWVRQVARSKTRCRKGAPRLQAGSAVGPRGEPLARGAMCSGPGTSAPWDSGGSAPKGAVYRPWEQQLYNNARLAGYGWLPLFVPSLAP